MHKEFQFDNLNDVPIRVCIPFFESGCDALMITLFVIFAEAFMETVVVSYNEDEKHTFIPILDSYQKEKEGAGVIIKFDHRFIHESYVMIPMQAKMKLTVVIKYKKVYYGTEKTEYREES